MVKMVVRAAVGVLLAVTAAACSSSSPKTGPTTTSGGNSPAVITASDALKFSPGTLSVNLGQTVTWTNNGSIAHNVTFDGGPAFSHSLDPGTTVTRTFTATGTFAFHCNIHGPSMHGTIIVK